MLVVDGDCSMETTHVRTRDTEAYNILSRGKDIDTWTIVRETRARIRDVRGAHGDHSGYTGGTLR